MASTEVKDFDSPEETGPFKGNGQSRDRHRSRAGTVGRGTFEPGWKWSDNVKPIAGTDSCQVFTPRLRRVGPDAAVHMDDGTEGEVGPGERVRDSKRSQR